jgi:hypothetical protein
MAALPEKISYCARFCVPRQDRTRADALRALVFRCGLARLGPQHRENAMTMRYAGACLGLALVVPAAALAAQQKITTVCFYESGQNGNQKISDYTIWNTASFPIPKGTVVSYTTTGAPGKTFTAKAPSNIQPQDTFSSGGTEPPGNCTAWWFK